MTARPIFPKSWRRPVCVAVALMLVAVLLAAGCIGGDVTREQDLTIIKLNHDGSMEWMNTYDSGKDDEITDLIQMSDGGYVIAGGYSDVGCNRASHFPTTPMVIRLSEKGDIKWEREYTSELADISKYENSIKGIVQTPDKGFYIISQQGMVVKINPSGIPGESRLHDTYPLNKTNVMSVNKTHDGGSILAGFTFRCKLDYDIERCPTDHKAFTAFVEKLDQNGNSVWFRSFADQDFFIASNIIELNDDNGYSSLMENKVNTSLQILDKNGLIINSSLFSSATNRTITGTRGLDFISVNMVQSVYGINANTILFVNKSDYKGEEIWDRQVTNFKRDKGMIHLRRIIETADGGYLMVLGMEKQKPCGSDVVSDIMYDFFKIIIGSRVQSG